MRGCVQYVSFRANTARWTAHAGSHWFRVIVTASLRKSELSAVEGSKPLDHLQPTVIYLPLKILDIIAILLQKPCC
jgi:hypothetical protein